MPYCLPGQKPKVIYKFANSGEKIYKLDKSPVDVRVSVDLATEDGQLPIRYEIFARDTSTGEIRSTDIYANRHLVTGSIKSIKVYGVYQFDTANGTAYRYWIESVSASGFYKTIIGLDNGYVGQNRWIFHEIKRFDNPSASPDSKCNLSVIFEDKTIFRDRGECPCNFTVQCTDCPDGYLRCDAPGYPGYCCIPCDLIAGQIAGIKHQVRRFNNG